VELEVVELVYLPQDNDKCRIIMKSAKEIFLLLQQLKSKKKANESMISI